MNAAKPEVKVTILDVRGATREQVATLTDAIKAIAAMRSNRAVSFGYIGVREEEGDFGLSDYCTIDADDHSFAVTDLAVIDSVLPLIAHEIEAALYDHFNAEADAC